MASNAVNIKFPLETSPNGYILKVNTTTNDAVKSKILLLLTTQKGERYYFPDYGTNLKRFLFEPNDDETHVEIENDIRKSLQKYIPGVTIKEINFPDPKDKLENPLESESTFILEILFQYTDDVFTIDDSLLIEFN